MTQECHLSHCIPGIPFSSQVLCHLWSLFNSSAQLAESIIFSRKQRSPALYKLTPLTTACVDQTTTTIRSRFPPLLPFHILFNMHPHTVFPAFLVYNVTDYQLSPSALPSPMDLAYILNPISPEGEDESTPASPKSPLPWNEEVKSEASNTTNHEWRRMVMKRCGIMKLYKDENSTFWRFEHDLEQGAENKYLVRMLENPDSESPSNLHSCVIMDAPKDQPQAAQGSNSSKDGNSS